MDTLTAGELVGKLMQMNATSYVEFEIPNSKRGDRSPIKGGDRVLISDVREIYYDSPDNTYVVLS